MLHRPAAASLRPDEDKNSPLTRPSFANAARQPMVTRDG